MNYRHILAGSLTFLLICACFGEANADRNEYARESSQTIALSTDGQIHATTPDGHVIVEAWDGDGVSLVITKRIRTRRDESSAEDYFDKMKVKIDQSPSTLRIEGDVPDFSMGYGFSIDYALRVPNGVSLDLRTSDGEVLATGVYGKVSARSSDGDISVKDAGDAELRTSDGDIRVDRIEGDVLATTSDGDIRVTNVAGDATIRSSDGDIECQEISGLVAIQLSDGDAHLETIRGGVSARSSDGELIVRDAEGPVELKTSDGNIELSLAAPIPMSRVTCTSSDGNIRFHLNETAAFTIEAKTSDGRVNVDFPGEFQRDKKGKRVEGHINGGGPAVFLRTSDGTINIDKT
jgi:DUF4097 and DUF4098 domain-containing protein YvlB